MYIIILQHIFGLYLKYLKNISPALLELVFLKSDHVNVLSMFDIDWQNPECLPIAHTPALPDASSEGRIIDCIGLLETIKHTRTSLDYDSIYVGN